MSTNVYDTANQLERELRESEAYVKLQAALGEIKSDADASAVFQEVQGIQMKLQQMQQSGQEITEEHIQEAQVISEKAGANEKVQNLMEAEQQISSMIDDLNRIIMQPIQDLYQAQGE
ncbi:YlbF family regulator [Desemzia sp. FAM 23991]|uniref:YlbF family regulator n=1 Tax=unclassified Desemzia TaxID=2685243 RepID=UPI00388540F9